MSSDQDLMDSIRKARKSGKNLDPGIMYDPKPTANEELNRALGAPKGTIIKSVPMPEYKPDPNETVDIGGRKFRRGEIKSAPMPMIEKKGGSIDLKKCKVSTAKKNSSSSKW